MRSNHKKERLAHERTKKLFFENAERALPDFARSFKGYDRPVPDIEIPSFEYKILPREPERIRLIRGHSKSVVLVYDRFANNNPLLDGKKYFSANKKLRRNSQGAYQSKNINLSIRSKSLPFTETPNMQNVFEGMNIYFGDMHTHSTFSNDCIEREKNDITPEEMFNFARDICNLDFLAITDHHQPWDIERNKIGEKNWQITLESAKKSTIEGEFLAFPGFEYRCVSNYSRGDTAIILGEDFSYSEIEDPSLDSITKLWDKFKGRNFSIPHFHNPGSLPANVWHECPYEEIEPVLEIYSCHGSYENSNPLENPPPEGKTRRPDRNAKYLLINKKIKYGLTCNSDGHKGNPGCNGLMAVYSPTLTKNAIFANIRKRHVYGTTNARIRLLFTANGALLGSILPQNNEKLFRISIAGEKTLKSVDLLRNGKLHTRFQPNQLTFVKNIKILDEGASFWYVRATQIDNHQAWSSPIWFE